MTLIGQKTERISKYKWLEDSLIETTQLSLYDSHGKVLNNLTIKETWTANRRTSTNGKQIMFLWDVFLSPRYRMWQHTGANINIRYKGNSDKRPLNLQVHNKTRRLSGARKKRKLYHNHIVDWNYRIPRLRNVDLARCPCFYRPDIPTNSIRKASVGRNKSWSVYVIPWGKAYFRDGKSIWKSGSSIGFKAVLSRRKRNIQWETIWDAEYNSH